MFDVDLAIRFAAALGLGRLLGLERKHDVELMFGGVRTFPLISLLGALGAFMECEMDQGWLLIASFVALSALVRGIIIPVTLILFAAAAVGSGLV